MPEVSVAEPGTRAGTSSNRWTVLAHSPAAPADAVPGFEHYLYEPRAIEPRLRELTLNRAGCVVGSQFVRAKISGTLRLGYDDRANSAAECPAPGGADTDVIAVER